MTFPDHFSGVSAAYAAFRPRYPDELFAYLATVTPGREVVWDVGTGSGQAAQGLARHFQHVIATDASSAQIEYSQPHPRIDYRVCAAEASGLDNASVDLVTVAQAVHWFDLPRFWPEVRRVARPGGAIAIWTYGLFDITPAIDVIVRRFYGGTVGPYWPAQRQLTEDRYETIDFPFAEVPAPSFFIERAVSLEEVAGYIRTWSATGAYMKQHNVDPVETLIAELLVAWGPPQQALLARWPIAMRVGRT